MLLCDAVGLFLDAKVGVVSKETRRWYRARLEPLADFLDGVDLEDVTVADLRRWRRSLVDKDCRWDNHPHRPEESGGLSPYTLYAYVNACRIFFSWLEDEGVIASSPARRLKLPPKPSGAPRKDIRPEDAKRILRAAREKSARDYAVLRFLADTGARLGGVAGLRLSYLDLTPDRHGIFRATIWEKGRGGEMKARTVYFHKGTAAALEAYLAVRPDADTDRVFLTAQRGRPARPLQKEGVYRMIQRYARQLGIEGRWNPHAWRHTFAKEFLRNGGGLKPLQQMMGHSSISVTADLYGNLDDETLAEMHARHSWLNGDLDDE